MQLKTKYLVLLLLITINSFGQENKVLVTETTVKVNAMSSEDLYFGFAEGDQVVLNFELVKGKDLKEIEVFEYPDASLFMDFKTKQIKDKIITINNEGIYKFSFKNPAIGPRIGKLKIERIPSSEMTKVFNTTVHWRQATDTTFFTEQERYLINSEYVSKSIVPPVEYFINSGSNATFKGGKSRITFPLSLPRNTVEWYYQFSSSRSKDEIQNTTKTFNLAGQLSKLIDQTGTLKFGIEALTMPPGADYCDIYLLNHENRTGFESKGEYSYFLSGTRKNIKSGLVKMDGGAGQSYYMGLKNPDPMHGIHVAIEIVAIVLNEEWGIRDIQKYKVTTWQEPYIKVQP